MNRFSRQVSKTWFYVYDFEGYNVGNSTNLDEAKEICNKCIDGYIVNASDRFIYGNFNSYMVSCNYNVTIR